MAKRSLHRAGSLGNYTELTFSKLVVRVSITYQFNCYLTYRQGMTFFRASTHVFWSLYSTCPEKKLPCSGGKSDAGTLALEERPRGYRRRAVVHGERPRAQPSRSHTPCVAKSACTSPKLVPH